MHSHVKRVNFNIIGQIYSIWTFREVTKGEYMDYTHVVQPLLWLPGNIPSYWTPVFLCYCVSIKVETSLCLHSLFRNWWGIAIGSVYSKCSSQVNKTWPWAAKVIGGQIQEEPRPKPSQCPERAKSQWKKLILDKKITASAPQQ